MTSIFSCRTSIHNAFDPFAEPSTRSGKPALGTYRINYTDNTSNIPVKDIIVRNSQGYKDLKLSADEFEINGKRLRIDAIDNNNGGVVTSSIFVGEAALTAFLEASTVLFTYSKEDSDISISTIDVRNSKGYKNLSLSVDTLPRNGKRIRIDSVDDDGDVYNTVFISEAAYQSFIDAATILMDFNING